MNKTQKKSPKSISKKNVKKRTGGETRRQRKGFGNPPSLTHPRTHRWSHVRSSRRGQGIWSGPKTGGAAGRGHSKWWPTGGSGHAPQRGDGHGRCVPQGWCHQHLMLVGETGPNCGAKNSADPQAFGHERFGGAILCKKKCIYIDLRYHWKKQAMIEMTVPLLLAKSCIICPVFFEEKQMAKHPQEQRNHSKQFLVCWAPGNCGTILKKGKK